MWCIPDKLDEEYILRMEDVLDLYEKPLNPREPVVCLDEKPLVLRASIRPDVPARPGRIRRVDSEYRRKGTANLFCAVEPKLGRYVTQISPGRTAREFAYFIRRVAKKYSRAKTIHLVVDNLNIHKLKSLTDTFGELEGRRLWSRFTVHYTPKHASWLNQAEIAMGIFETQCLRGRVIPSIEVMRNETRAWTRSRNRAKKRIDWRFTTRDARIKFSYRRCRRVLFTRQGH